MIDKLFLAGNVLLRDEHVDLAHHHIQASAAGVAAGAAATGPAAAVVEAAGPAAAGTTVVFAAEAGATSPVAAAVGTPAGQRTCLCVANRQQS